MARAGPPEWRLCDESRSSTRMSVSEQRTEGVTPLEAPKQGLLLGCAYTAPQKPRRLR